MKRYVWGGFNLSYKEVGEITVSSMVFLWRT